MDSPPDFTAELIARVRSGEQTAWADFYHAYHDQLLLAVRCRLEAGVRSRMQKKGMLQAVFVEALQEMGQFDVRRAGNLRHFLNVLITNKVRDRARASSTRSIPMKDAFLEEVPDTAGFGYYDRERFERLERCMDRLPEKMRKAVILRKIEGLSSKELAYEFDMSDCAARKLYSRAQAKLRALYDGP